MDGKDFKFKPHTMSTPMRSASISGDQSPPDVTDEEIPKNRKVGAKQKLKVMDLICEGIKLVGVPRKGASYQAIKKYVQSKQENPESARVVKTIKKELIKGIENGIFSRASASKNAVGVNGSYMLTKVAPKTTEVSKKQKKPEVHKEQVSDSEVTVKKSKPKKKLNLSDTSILDIKKANEAAKPKPIKVTAAKTGNVKSTKGKPTKVVAVKESGNVKNDEGKPKKTAAVKESGNVKNKVKPTKVAAIADETENVRNGKGRTARVAATKNLRNARTVKDNPTEAPAAKTVNGKTGKVKPPKKVKGAGDRADVSDSEFMVKKPNRKSLKSYSSDPEAGDSVFLDKTRALIKQKVPMKQEHEVEAVDNSPQNKPPSKTLKGRKLYKEDRN